MKDREFVGLWVALAIIGAVAILAYRSIDATADTLGWVEESHKVRQQLEDVSSSYARAASARRAYVIAGDESQLDDTPGLDSRLNRSLDELRRLLENEPNQLPRIDTLGRLYHTRLGDLETAVAERRQTGVGRDTPEGLAITTKIRDVREELEQEENRVLAERDAKTRGDVYRTKVAEVVGTLASFALLLLAFRRLRREIGRRRRSEEALRANEGYLDSIIENLPDMIFVKQPGDLRYARINRAGEELLGVARKDVVDKTDFDVFPKTVAEQFRARDREALAGRVVVEVAEESVTTKEGERWLHTKTVPIVGVDGEPAYLLGISEDVTERRKADEALKRAKEAAEAANRELEAFSYSVAHDLRAPLRAIDGFSAALEEEIGDRLDDTSKGHLDRVRRATKRMGELIDALLGLSRVARRELTKEKIDLTKMAREAYDRLREAQPERQVELVVEEGLTAEGDAHLLGAVFDNLLGNAWKFTGKVPHARIEVGRADGEKGNGTSERPSVFVRDNGAGFDQAHADRLFTAFHRLHSTKEFEGTGIGLATVHRIVRRHGGKIWAEGRVDEGATFYFSI